MQDDVGGSERDESSFLTVLTKLHVCRPLADGLTVVSMWTRFHNVTEGWSSAAELLNAVWFSHRRCSNNLNWFNDIMPNKTIFVNADTITEGK